MRVMDQLSLPISAMWQQKTRTLLTTLGVVFGSFVLAASLSIGQGVQETLERESRGDHDLRTVYVHPNWQGGKPVELKEEVEVSGEMSDAKRKRIHDALTEYKRQSQPSGPGVQITQERLKTLAGLAHVESVIPVVSQHGYAIIEDHSGMAVIGATRPQDAALTTSRLLTGRFFESSSDRTAVISEFLAYRLGIQDEAAVRELVGKKIRLEFRTPRAHAGLHMSITSPDGGESSREAVSVVEKMKKMLPLAIDLLDLTEPEKDVLRKATAGGTADNDSTFAEEYTIAGVVRLTTEEEAKDAVMKGANLLYLNSDVMLPVDTALDLYFRRPGEGERGIDQAHVIVDREKNVKDVVAKISETGLHCHAPIEFIERERLMYLLIFAAMTCVAAVALLVASLGIANTMLMSVLERTREIGIMKAVGAGNGQLQLIFLIEGALIGLCGGVTGLLLAWGASIPGDAWVREMVFREMKIELKEKLFVFPIWLILVVLGFAILFTTLAAVYPARRAASVDPVSALRHE